MRLATMYADTMRWRGSHIRAALSYAAAGLGLVGCGADSVGNQLVPFPGQVLGSPSPGIRTPALKDGRYIGQDVPNPYGDVQVEVTTSGGRITDVQALALPSDRQRSAEISQSAGPLLHGEVVQVQSAQLDIVTGATFTSDGYAQSVQSALDQAHG
jgi:uncharacterized protein with FMN-binding domain